MKEQDLKDADIIPINKYVLCLGEESKEALIDLPETGTVSSAYKVLVVKHVASDCEKVKLDDVVFIGPLAKSSGTIDYCDKRYLMVKEDDIAFISRRKATG